LAPIVAGYLFQDGYSLPTVATIMSVAALLAAGVLSLLKLKPDQPEADVAPTMTPSIGGASTPA
jgi:hypothetical protein